MTRSADAELIGYLADNHDQARLVLREVSDTHAALAALKKAAAMRSIRHASGTGGRRAEWNRLSDGTLPLYPLRQHRDGLTLAELCTRMPEEYAQLSPVIEKLEHTGELVRWRGDDGSIRLRLTEGGRRAMDEHMRERAADSLILIEDVPAERVAIVRHVCVQAVLNGERLEEGPSSEPPRTGAFGPAARRPARDEQDRLHFTACVLRTAPRTLAGHLSPGGDDRARKPQVTSRSRAAPPPAARGARA